MKPAGFLRTLRGADGRSLLRAVLLLFALSSILGAHAAAAAVALAPLGAAYCLPAGGPSDGERGLGHDCVGLGCPIAPQVGAAAAAGAETVRSGVVGRLVSHERQHLAAIAIYGIGARGPPA